MLIVCTKDATVVATAQNPRSGSGAWGRLVIIDPTYSQARATAAMEKALDKYDGILCFSAHGSDHAIGDAGSGPNDWTWTRDQIAAMLANSVVPRFTGPILIHACAERVSNFSAGLAVELEARHALNHVWIYGYQRPVPVSLGYPDPTKLDRNRELFGSQVDFRRRDAVQSAT